MSALSAQFPAFFGQSFYEQERKRRLMEEAYWLRFSGMKDDAMHLMNSVCRDLEREANNESEANYAVEAFEGEKTTSPEAAYESAVYNQFDR